MGSFLSWVRPSTLFQTLCPGDQLGKPSYHACDVPPAPRFHTVEASLNLASQLPCEDQEALPCPHQHPGHLVDLHQHHYLVEQARYLFLGVFSSLFWRGQQKPGPTIPEFRKPCSSVILNVASAQGGKLSLHLVLERSVLTIWAFLTGHLSSPYGRETQRSPPEKTSQVQAKEEKDASTLGNSGEGLARKKESPPVTTRQWRKGRDSDGNASTPSAFKRLMVNGVPASFIPRPGPLNPDYCCKNSSKALIKTSSKRPSSKRNAIASSYSSSSGLQLPKRHGSVNAAKGDIRLPHAASSQFQVPAKEASADGHRISTAASEAPQRNIKPENVDHGLQGQQQTQRNLVPSSDLPKPGRRKIPLLLPSRRDIPLILPQDPELEFLITVEIYDSEKRAAMRQLNSFLMGKTEA